MATRKHTAKLEAQETEDTKTCLCCGKIKLLNAFGFHAKGRKLCQTYCLKCANKKAKDYDIARQYDITLLQYDEMLRQQSGSCAICGKKRPGGGGRFHIDHDHKTGKIRGLLCSNCNRALGLMQDNFEILSAAARYLKNQCNFSENTNGTYGP